MALAKVLSLIHANISKIGKDLEEKLPRLVAESQHHIITNGNNYINILAQVRNLIEESYCGADLKKIADAIKFIEQIPFQFHNRKKPIYFWSILRKNDYAVFENLEDKAHLDPLLHTNKCEDLFGTIHLTLVNYYQKYLRFKPRWQTNLPDDGQQEVTNEYVEEWQEDQSELNGTYKGYVDFRRGISFGEDFVPTTNGIIPIPPLNNLSDDEYNARLKKFVSHAFAYSEKEKEIIFEWLRENGGQGNSRALDKMLSNGYLTEPAFFPGVSKAIEQHWYISRSGKICFNYDVLYFSLQQGTNLTLFMALPEPRWNEGKSKLRYHGKYAETPEDLMDIKPERRRPVMRINMVEELNVDEALKVMPAIKHLQANAFTRLLDKKIHVENNVYYSKAKVLGN